MTQLFQSLILPNCFNQSLSSITFKQYCQFKITTLIKEQRLYKAVKRISILCFFYFQQLIQTNKIIFNMNLIHKHSEELLQGWSNQTDINKDQLILRDILKRKTITGAFPRLADLKIQKSSCQLTSSPLKLKPVRINHLLNIQCNRIGARQRTEGVKQLSRDSISPLKKKLVQILNEQQQQVKNTPQTIIQQSVQQDRSRLSIHKDQQNQPSTLKYRPNQKDKKFKATGILQKLKSKQLLEKGKKTQSKMYMKLNALQILQDFQKNIFRETTSIQNLTSKNRLMEQNKPQPLTMSSKEMILKKHQIQQKQEKVSEKLKQTFFKFDVFDKDKVKKKQKVERLDLLTEYNDRILFCNSSLKFSVKSQTKRRSPFKTTQKRMTKCQDFSNLIKFHKKQSPHCYKLTIN